MGMEKIFGGIMIFSLLSIIFIFIAILNIGIVNDYVLYTLEGVAQNMTNQGTINNVSMTAIDNASNGYTNFDFKIDDLWFIAYLVFLISSFIAAYTSRKKDYFSFFGYMFYIIMFFLFMLSIFATVTNWFNVNILLAVIPSSELVLPKFYFYLSHIGVFSLFQMVVCLVINQLDFDFTKIIGRKKLEEKTLEEDDEIV
jgi:hypothetical protein